MPYSLVNGGGTLYKMDTAGALTTLTIPAGVTISTSKVARMTALQRYTAVVNAPSRSLLVDGNATVYPLQLFPPTSPVILAATGSGNLSGTFQVKYTYIVKDPNNNNIILESDFSPISKTSPSLTNQLLSVTGIGKSPDAATTHRRLYRTTTGPGTVFYPWVDLEGNKITSLADDLADASLSLLPAPTELGTAPGLYPSTSMTNITSWKNRLWGVGDQQIDTIRFSGNGLTYGWPAAYSFTIPPQGADQYGITGLMARRDELGVARRNFVWKVIGTDNTDFRLVKVIEGKGCWAPDSVQVVRDVAYFLGEDGVYTWDANGVICISDPDGDRGRVKSWFNTDSYFNRSQWPNAVARYNPRYHHYELFLSAIGSTVLDRWVSYDIYRKQWYGPHKTDAFTPTWGAVTVDTNNFTIPVVGGSNGFIYKQDPVTFSDDTTAISPIGIAASMTTGAFHGNAPDIDHYWDLLSVIYKLHSSKGVCTINVHVGDQNSSTSQVFTLDLTLGRTKLARCGRGRFLFFDFNEATAGQELQLFGFEVPFFEAGRR